MTPSHPPAPHPAAARRRTLRTATDIAAAGLAPAPRMAEIEAVAERYAVAITPALADLIDPTDPNDPIARQFIPDTRELTATPAERADPIGDDSHSPVKGIVHRYPDRVLLTPILHCPVYCRFCFRREKVGGEEAVLGDGEMAAALDYIRAHRTIWEVVITGGDPLMLPSSRLAEMVRALDAITHVRTIRFHSRVPVSDPDRIGQPLLDALQSETALWVAVHCNHARELSEAARAACRRLTRAGIPLISQTVLLKDVNDSPAALEELMRALVAARIKPYYLHHLDLAHGTDHFRVPIAAGQDLMRHLRGRVSGLCQPSYVLDIPGGHGKAPIGPVYLDGDRVEDWQGGRHRYPPERGD
ncbi:lysine-2,3-aminomutase-like protein [Telmatospirillum siberiense]|uniref:Lysine-2,3-aminomutase-like protein n=1 Tax=Telmatospirillum siberiense TaxID=382514 RepID=A0A2N3Q177_9PROT|nr:lysine-2,3-aminomutase-like protein [Telmatospirillum siberiense]PKU26403.1 lysine-2,3-aminomutase-like protein [Telmatospirillum siberiense]